METAVLTSLTQSPSWQMWATFLIVIVTVWFYIREKFSIETISVGVIVALLLFFHFFSPTGQVEINSSTLLSGFAAPALITIMALLVVGQGMFQTGALESPIMTINNALDKSPRRTLAMVFGIAFGVSMFMNNTPVVVMFIPVLSAMSSRLRQAASRYICLLYTSPSPRDGLLSRMPSSA